jgi:threonine aldolase
MTQGFDTAWLDFTKGLGAPLGACLAASAELIDEAWRYKQMLGGAMRQAGIVAAGALYALEHNVERLAVDHENALALAQGLAEIEGVTLDPGEIETNIVIFEVDDPVALCERLERDGVRMGAVGQRRVRAVTHLDVDAEGVHRAVEAVRRAL